MKSEELDHIKLIIKNIFSELEKELLASIHQRQNNIKKDLLWVLENENLSHPAIIKLQCILKLYGKCRGQI